MTKEEAIDWLFTVKFVLSDAGESWLAGFIEDIELAVRHMNAELCREYADHILPGGYRGHVRLVLSRPYEARVFAFLAALLRSIE